MVLKLKFRAVGFALDKDKIKKLNDWIEPHMRESAEITSGHFTYSFTPTSQGVITKVKCSCGEEIDLTDYESW